MLGIAFGLGSWGVVLTMLNPAGATKASSPNAAAALNLATAATADVRKPYACSSYVTVNYSAAAVMLVATAVLLSWLMLGYTKNRPAVVCSLLLVLVLLLALVLMLGRLVLVLVLLVRLVVTAVLVSCIIFVAG